MDSQINYIRKFVLLTVLLTLSYNGLSQERIDKIIVKIAGITIYPTVLYEDMKIDEAPKGEWYLKYPERGTYLMFFEKSAEGYKQCIDRLKSILDNNNLSFENDRFKENILIPDHCDGIYDNDCLHSAFIEGDAEIMIGWKTENNEGISIFAREEGYYIGLLKL